MIPLRGARVRRTLTLLLLLLAVADLGVHGLFASDYAPVATGSTSVRLTPDSRGPAGPSPTDHCFCHGLSVGAVVPASTAVPAQLGVLVLGPLPPLPRATPGPLDKPPQLAA